MELYKKLKATGQRYISCSDYIKSHTKTRAIAALRLQFEELLMSEHSDVAYERTSEIFITKGTKKGERNIKYYPVHEGYYISHLIIRSNYPT